jgi:hypothetical protein
VRGQEAERRPAEPVPPGQRAVGRGEPSKERLSLPETLPPSPAAAPETVTFAHELTERFRQLHDSSKRGQAGGVLVRAEDKGLVLAEVHTEDVEFFFWPGAAGPEVVGVFHTHPDPAGGISFSGRDLAALINSGARVAIVQSGPDQFLLLRTQKTPKEVAPAVLGPAYDAAVRRLLVEAKSPAEATQAAVASLAPKYGLAYYQGKGGILTKVPPPKEK